MKKIVIVLAIWFVGIGLIGLCDGMDVEDVVAKYPTISVVVREDQTIWDLANKVDPGNKVNNHIIVEAIEEINNLDSMITQPGQELQIPNLGGNN
jgi:hypothetical protein